MRLNHLAKLSGALILTAGLAGNASANDYRHQLSPHEACKVDEKRDKILSGGIGALGGAIFGSQVAGNGARTEASIIGGLLGGLAGAGFADKRVDCDPVYPVGETYQTSTYESAPINSSATTVSTLPTTTVYGSTPTYSTAPTTHYSGSQYSQAQYGTRTTVSDHPVYSDPSYGAQPVRSYVSRPVSQPSYTSSSYNQPTYSQPSYSQTSYQTARYVQPRVISSSTHYSQPRTTFIESRTSYSQPISYARPHWDRSRRHGHHGGFHHHGKYSCYDKH